MTEHLRAHLEAIRDRNAGVEGSVDDSPLDYADAVAALDILNEAELAGHRRREMFTHPEQHYDHEEMVGDDRFACRLVPDPVPGSTIATRETHT